MVQSKTVTVQSDLWSLTSFRTELLNSRRCGLFSAQTISTPSSRVPPCKASAGTTKDLPGIPICHKHEYVRCDICGGDDTIKRILGKCSSSYEPRWHIRVSFKTCAIPITWFSCVQKFFNAAMGILVGTKCVQHPPLVFTSVITRSLQWLEKEASPPFRSKQLQHLDVHAICK